MKGCHSVNGFTLIEMLLVLVIISMVIGLLAANIGDSPQQLLSREAKRLESLFRMTAYEATLQGDEFGLVLADKGYEFVKLDAETMRWQRFEEGSYSFYRLPEGLSLRLEKASLESINDYDVEVSTLRLMNDKDIQPLVLIMSSGEMSLFSISIQHDGTQQRGFLMNDTLSGMRWQAE